MEIGSFTLTHEWTKVEFAAPIANPVVVLSPLTYNGQEQATTRVRNVTETGFEAQIIEWSYLDGYHIEESVSYIAMEEGVHTVNGLMFQALSVEAGKDTKSFNFNNKAQLFNFLYRDSGWEFTELALCYLSF